MVRYYEETPCPHDRWAEIGHVEDGFDDRTMDYRPPEGKTHPNHWCPGGQRRELTGVEVGPGVYASGAISIIRGRYLIIPLEEPADG